MLGTITNEHEALIIEIKGEEFWNFCKESGANTYLDAVRLWEEKIRESEK